MLPRLSKDFSSLLGHPVYRGHLILSFSPSGNHPNHFKDERTLTMDVGEDNRSLVPRAGKHGHIPAWWIKVIYAHGILASLAWVVLIPMGAILLRVLEGKRAFWCHVVIQSLSVACYVVAVGMGIWLGLKFEKVRDCLPSSRSISSTVLLLHRVLPALSPFLWP